MARRAVRREYGSRLNAVRKVDEGRNREIESHGPGPMSNKELARRQKTQRTLHGTLSERTGNSVSAAVMLPDCNFVVALVRGGYEWSIAQ